MRTGEFELIRRHFTRAPRHALLGVGDDCALLAPPVAGQAWAVSSDLLVEGRHFLPTVPPERLGHKALAVNLSDLAACGAEPVACTLALVLPQVDDAWLTAFAAGFWALADAHGCDLVGGDTTRGPLTVGVTVMGVVPDGQALLRSGAVPGDDVYVSGRLGGARLALEAFRGSVSLAATPFAEARAAMECPVPRVALGVALRGLATAAIDLSDGLLGDLAHVLERSHAGALLRVDDVPAAASLTGQSTAVRRLCTLAGGDDYELLFTAPPARAAAVRAAAAAAGTAATCIGRIEAEPGLRLVDGRGASVAHVYAGHDHFAA